MKVLNRKPIFPARIILSVLSVLLAHARGIAGDYYVATTGSDSTGTGTAFSPWKTVAHALAAIEPTPHDPAVIHIASGTYRLSLTGEQYPLRLKSNTTLRGEGDSVTVLYAAGSLQNVLTIDSVTNVTVEGLTIRGGRGAFDGGAGRGAGILMIGSNWITIRRNTIRGNSAGGTIAAGGGVYGLWCSHILVTENEIVQNRVSADGCTGGGLFLRGTDLMVSRNRIGLNQALGLAGGAAGGLSIGGSRVVVMENVIDSNWAELQSGLACADTVLVIRNTVWRNAAGDSDYVRGCCGGGVTVQGMSVVGGSVGNGNNIHENIVIPPYPSAPLGHQLYQDISVRSVEARHNFFGSGVDPHNPDEVLGNFRVDPYATAPVVFDTIGAVAVPSPVVFDTVAAGDTARATLRLFNVINSLTDSLRVDSIVAAPALFSASRQTLLIAPVHSDTIDVFFSPVSDGVYSDTLRFWTNVGVLPVAVRGAAATPAGAAEDVTGVPARFGLEQNFPNPFNPSTTLRFSLPAASRARLVIVDILGRTVAVPADGFFGEGAQSVEWNATGLPSGVYICGLRAGADVARRKVLRVR